MPLVPPGHIENAPPESETADNRDCCPGDNPCRRKDQHTIYPVHLRKVSNSTSKDKRQLPAKTGASATSASSEPRCMLKYRQMER